MLVGGGGTVSCCYHSVWLWLRFSYLWYVLQSKRFSYLLGFSSEKVFVSFRVLIQNVFVFWIQKVSVSYLSFPAKIAAPTECAGIRMSSSTVDRQHHGNLAGPAQISLTLYFSLNKAGRRLGSSFISHHPLQYSSQ